VCGGIVTHLAEHNLIAEIRWKILASIFFDQDCILLINYLPKGRTINAEYYSSLLVQLKDIHRIILTWIFMQWGGGMHGIKLAQDTDRWLAIVNVVMNLRVLHAGNFFTS
jgi:hypothetical protein